MAALAELATHEPARNKVDEVLSQTLGHFRLHLFVPVTVVKLSSVNLGVTTASLKLVQAGDHMVLNHIVVPEGDEQCNEADEYALDAADVGNEV